MVGPFRNKTKGLLWVDTVMCVLRGK